MPRGSCRAASAVSKTMRKEEHGRRAGAGGGAGAGAGAGGALEAWSVAGGRLAGAEAALFQAGLAPYLAYLYFLGREDAKVRRQAGTRLQMPWQAGTPHRVSACVGATAPAAARSARCARNEGGAKGLQCIDALETKAAPKACSARQATSRRQRRRGLRVANWLAWRVV